MKILISSIIDLKKSQHNRPHQFVKHLSKRHDVTVLSINDWWKGKQDNLVSYSKDFDDIFKRIQYHYLSEKKISPILQELLLRANTKKIISKGNFDVHLNYNSLITGYEISKKIKTVFDLADDLVAMIEYSPQIPKALRPFGAYMGKYFLNKDIEKAQYVTLTTHSLAESCNIPEEKIIILPNGVDTDLFKQHSNAKQELGLDGFIVGYVGVLREWVDFEPVFKALKLLNENIKMVIVGKEGYFNENVKLANDLGVSDRVIFTGMIPYSTVPKYISAMDVCLIPFKLNAISRNALPLKLFEYMSCEKPVISVEIPGVKSIAANKVLYASKDSDYKEKISMLYENDGLRIDMGEKGRKFVEKNYDWAKITDQLENILLDTATGR